MYVFDTLILKIIMKGKHVLVKSRLWGQTAMHLNPGSVKLVSRFVNICISEAQFPHL